MEEKQKFLKKKGKSIYYFFFSLLVPRPVQELRIEMGGRRRKALRCMIHKNRIRDCRVARLSSRNALQKKLPSRVISKSVARSSASSSWSC